ncbi:SMODS domain-containing nucleotidyltransferase [Amycolatopsis japonica]
MTSTPAQFNQMIQNISLKDAQIGRIESAVGSLTKYLLSAYTLGKSGVFLQGSYANGTAVKPRSGGEYDVDIVACVGLPGQSPNAALNKMAEQLRKNGLYADRVTPKERCIRLQYADEGLVKFHVDVVPARFTEPNYYEAPKRGEEWKATTPLEFTQWCDSRGQHFKDLVRILKRWRDEQQDVRAAVKSILLQVLVANCMSNSTDQAQLVVDTFRGIHEFLMQPGVPAVYNPTLSSENLASRWTVHECNRFRAQIAKASESAERAFKEEDPVKSQLLWKELFKTAYPDVPARERPEVLEKKMAAVARGRVERPQDKGWVEHLAHGSQIGISADIFDNHRNYVISRRVESDSAVLQPGWYVQFRANVSYVGRSEVWWRVVNTGEQAKMKGGFRGDFFKSDDRESNKNEGPLVNWELLQYSGRHWIEAFLVRGGVIVARSAPFYVNVA